MQPVTPTTPRRRLHLEAGGLHHVSPHGHVLAHAFGERVPLVGDDGVAALQQLGTHLRVVDRSHDLGMELVENVGRQLGRRRVLGQFKDNISMRWEGSFLFSSAPYCGSSLNIL